DHPLRRGVLALPCSVLRGMERRDFGASRCSRRQGRSARTLIRPHYADSALKFHSWRDLDCSKLCVRRSRRLDGKVRGGRVSSGTPRKARFGEARARLYAEAQEAGVRKIKSLVTQYAIDCELEPKAAYVYTCDESYLGRIEEEVEIAQAFGLPASFWRK